MSRYQYQFCQWMFLEFLGQNLPFDNAESDTDTTVTYSGVVWSCPLVFRGADVDISSEVLIFTINCTISIIRCWLFPQNWWYQYLPFGWNLVPYELVPVPKAPLVTPSY